MSWDRVIQETWREGEQLAPAVERLFESQRRDWPAFASGEAALASIQTKTLDGEDGSVTVQANPGRKRSTHAKTDAKSIAERRCFLCPENMPPEERGIAFGDLVIAPNPFPVLPMHCTIPSREHTPQRIEGRVATLLQLAGRFGPEMFVFYNGPRCGASAPDHFHFQAALAEPVPVLRDASVEIGPERVDGHESFGRRYLVLTGSDPAAVGDRIERAIGVLGELTGDGDEPMLNLIVHGRQDGLIAVLFPRAAHRPSCYFLEGPERIAVSPAALEMAGLLVCADPEDFEKVRPAEAETIYQEVSLDADRFAQLWDRLR